MEHNLQVSVYCCLVDNQCRISGASFFGLLQTNQRRLDHHADAKSMHYWKRRDILAYKSCSSPFWGRCMHTLECRWHRTLFTVLVRAPSFIALVFVPHDFYVSPRPYRLLFVLPSISFCCTHLFNFFSSHPWCMGRGCIWLVHCIFARMRSLKKQIILTRHNFICHNRIILNKISSRQSWVQFTVAWNKNGFVL